MKNYIQIGANIGNDDFQKMIMNSQEKLKVILVEPNTNLIDSLSNNYNNLKDKHEIIIFPYGISLSNEMINFYLYDDIHGNSSILDRRTHPVKSHYIKIPTVTFNNLCEQFNISEIELLFIDTEGFDYEILNSIDLSKVNNPKYQPNNDF